MVFPDFNIDGYAPSSMPIEKTDTPKLGRVFLFDTDSNNHVLQDGKVVEASDIEAVKQWVGLVIKTEKGKYKVYDKKFGMELEQFKGRRDIPMAFVRSEIERQLEEQLLKHVLIESVSNVQVDVKNGGYYISFSLGMHGLDDEIEVGEYSA